MFLFDIIQNIPMWVAFIIVPICLSYFYWKVQCMKFEEQAEEELPLWGMPKEEEISGNCPVNVTDEKFQEKQEHISYEETQIDEEEEKFFENFLKTIQEDCETDENNELILTMDSWNEKEGKEALQVASFSEATAKISDNKPGEQVWIVEVVGEEQGYIHVSDGTARAWVFADKAFNKGDILSLVVNRNGEAVEFIHAEILQHRSKDFVIYDDEDWIYEEHESYVSAC